MKTLPRLTVGLLVISAGVVLFGLLLTPEDTAPEQFTGNSGPLVEAPAPPAVSPGSPKKPSALISDSVAPEVPETLPASLRGTAVPDGWARTDRLGNLIPTAELRALFEYFLSALGEETLPQLVARIESALGTLAEPARSQARSVLGAYLDYKLAVSELEQAYGSAAANDIGEMQRRMAEVHGLRRTWLDADTVDAFFADEEANDRFQLELRRIATNDTLSAAERREAQREAERLLPEPLREAREQTRRFSDYEQARQALADDPKALQAWREQAFGAEAADRLARVEQEQRAWDSRWQAYATERDRILASGLAEPELAEALDRLRGRHFNETEQVRAEALDSIR